MTYTSNGVFSYTLTISGYSPGQRGAGESGGQGKEQTVVRKGRRVKVMVPLISIRGDEICMAQWRPLRVLIVGQQGAFERVLATNIQCWGYEAVTLSPESMMCADAMEQVEGDVLICDLDEVFGLLPISKGTSLIERGLLAADFIKRWNARWSHTRLTIALSSRSVSRTTLEQIGAVALLQKPFVEMSRLQRYLKVLQRLILSQTDSGTLPQLSMHEEKTRVLVVDDDKEIARAIQQCLMDEPEYEVAVAHDGLDALELCLDWQPQCIVTDLLMPWMNGYQVMRCLSAGELQPMPAFVVMSALTQLEVPVNRSYLKGKAVVYVDKPFDFDYLLTAIKQVCAG